MKKIKKKTNLKKNQEKQLETTRINQSLEDFHE
jgi:hypothetical protein